MNRIAGYLTAFVLGGSLATEAIKFRSELTLTSPNGRFEIRLIAMDDGCQIRQLDTVKGRVIVLEVTADDGCVIGIGEKLFAENGAYQAAMKTDGGFVQWGRQIEVP